MADPSLRSGQGLPSGTVTFLFTDIEGSTARWEGAPDAMRVALARHDALVRAAIVQHHGHVVKTTGDGFHAAFARAPDALAAALDAQRRLHAEPWREIGQLRVRMALHTGAAEERDGDYYGPPLNRAARLLSAGHGGQILLSEVTTVLVREALPSQVRLLDLGRHRLKDLTEPERASQVVAPDLASDFPPLASLDARPNNLPTHPTALLGRERELADVRGLLKDGARLVTLTGPGGTGKTRLGLQVAADLMDDFEHGVFLVELAPISDPALVPSTVAQVLGVRDVGSRPIVDALKEHLRARSVLLLLDNFEQILPAASVVADLLAACPGLAVLVTSREPLRLRAEHEYAVPPLALPDARQGMTPDVVAHSPAVGLFVQRARAVRTDFALTDENAPAVVEICTRLDGLPLAIELAAARITLLSPEALLHRLERRLPLLTGGARDLPARQQTLRDAIAWSHDLLDETERVLFRRLAIFVGGFTLQSAVAVGDPDVRLSLDVLDGIASLVAKSLVGQQEQADGEPRFGMLETIREYGLEQLEGNGEAATIRRWHAEYYLGLAEAAEPELTGRRQAAWLDRLEAEHDNLRAALHWAIERGDAEAGLRLAGALAWFWYVHGHWNEGFGQLAAALTASAGASPSARAKALHWAGFLAHARNDLGGATALLEEGRSLFRDLGDPRGMAQSLGHLGIVARDERDYARAAALCAESLALYRDVGDTHGVGTALWQLGSVARNRGDRERAAALFEESLARCRDVGNTRGVANALTDLGLLAYALGTYERVAVLLGESLALSRELGDRHNAARSLRGLGDLARTGGDDERATALLEQGLTLHQELGGSAFYQAECLGGFAWVAGMRGQPTRAARLFGAAEAVRDAIGAPLLPAERAGREHGLAAVRAALGNEAFEAAWAEGRAMTLEQAVACALEDAASG